MAFCPIMICCNHRKRLEPVSRYQLQRQPFVLRRFWPFDKYAYRFIPQYLEEQERKGLRFSSIGFWLPIAKYKKIEPREVHYDVSLIEPKVYTEIQPYLDVCEEAGWDLVWQLEECKIFRTREGHAPVPLETDSIVELEKVKSMEKQGLRLDC